MQTSALRDRLTTAIGQDRVLTLDTSLVPEAGVLAAYLDPNAGTTARIIIRDASIAPGSDPITVQGTATLTGLTSLPVVLAARGDDQSTSLRLTFAAVPSTWRLPMTFGTFPQYWAGAGGGTVELQPSFLDTLPLFNVSIVVSTDAADGIAPGVNLSGTLVVDDTFGNGLMTTVLRWGQGTTPLHCSGTIRLTSGRPPAIDLRAPLDETVRLSIASLTTGRPFLWMRTLVLPDSPDPVSRMDIAVPVTIGNPRPMEMTIAGDVGAGGRRFGLWGESEDDSFSLGNGLTDVAALAGLSANDFKFPDGLDALSKLYVREVGAGFSVDPPGLDFLSLTLALPADPPWDTPIPNMSITDIETGWVVSFGGGVTVDGYVEGVFRLGKDNPVDLQVRADFPTFRLTAQLEVDPAKPFSVSDAITHFIDVPDLPEIDLTALYLSATPQSGDFSLSGSLADNWSFPLGAFGKFSIGSAYFALNRSATAGFSGTVGGDAKLGSATLAAGYSFPGSNFVIDGRIPSIGLGELIATLSDRAIALPDELNLTLTDSEVVITKSASDFTFLLRTSIAAYGTLFFEILRTAQQGWGAAVGVDLSAVQRLGDVKPFGFLNAVDLTFERLILVLSSADLPAGYVFPDVASRSQSVTPARRSVAIPTSIGTPKQGINLFAAFAFGDRSKTGFTPLVKLYDYFTISRIDLDVAVQVSGQGENISALLIAGASADASTGSIGGQAHNLTIAAYLGIKYTGGAADLFLRGQLALDAPGGAATASTLSFAMELGIEENGCYIAGSMIGSWSGPFGVSGLTISDVALEVGADWDGIPTVGFAGTLTAGPFNGSLACVVNTIEPSSSILAGSLSDVRLGDVLSTFVTAVGQPDAEMAKVIEVLDHISITGVRSFTLPSSVAAALDAKDLTAVAQAFSTYAKVTLTPTPQAMLLVVGTPGRAWFITDKSRVPQHYEVSLDGDHLTARLEAQLYIAPNATAIAGMTFLQGYQIYGTLNVFGFSEMTAVTISTAQGIAIEERMSEIDLFDGKLRLRRAPDDTRGDGEGDRATRGGPYVSMATFSQPSLQPPYRSAHFIVSGAFSFIGIVDLVLEIVVSTAGLHVVIERNLLDTDFKLAFDVSSSPLSVSGGGSAGFAVRPRVDLKKYGLGTFTPASVRFDAECQFGVSGQSLSASAAGDFSFDVPEFGTHLGPYHVSCDLLSAEQALAHLPALFEAAVRDVERIASDLFDVLKRDATKFTALAKSGVIALDDSLDHVLQSVFHVNLADVTATTSCFATKSVAPRLRTASALAVPAPSGGDPLDLLRRMRADLGGSAMGQWLLNVYNTISEPMVHLYDYQPADPNAPTLKQVLDVDHGDVVYGALLHVLQAAGSGQPVTIPQAVLPNAQQIVADLLDLAAAYTAAGPQQQREGTLIQQGVTALLDQLPALADLAGRGLTYQQLKDHVASMPAPANPFTESR